VASTDPDFSTFFLKFYTMPYDTWASLDHADFDFVMRFERLDDDFETVIRRLGIEPVRRLPALNSTGGRGRDFHSYYSAEAQRRAVRIMGPYMRRWGYSFPASWPLEPSSKLDEIRYAVYSRIARAYWRHLRPRT
jgi:hypothetical protein